jgi:hypothetical protein
VGFFDEITAQYLGNGIAEINGTIPILQGEYEVYSSIYFTTTLPLLQGEYHDSPSFGFEGTFPALAGHYSGTIGGLNFNGVIPAIDGKYAIIGSKEIGVNGTFGTIAGEYIASVGGLIQTRFPKLSGFYTAKEQAPGVILGEFPEMTMTGFDNQLYVSGTIPVLDGDYRITNTEPVKFL